MLSHPQGWWRVAQTDCHPTAVALHRSIQSPRKGHIMFTPSDIVVLILLAGSVILIWIARRASFAHREDVPKAHDHESPCSAEQMELHGETKNPTGSCQSKENDSSCNSK